MSELLTRPALQDGPRSLGDPPAALDAYTRARIDEAAAAAYERGRRDGAAAASAQATAAAQRISGALERAVAAVVAELTALRDREAAADVELAAAIAETVLGREPNDDSAVLLQRVRSVLARLEDTELVVHVHPGDVAAVADGLHAEAAVRVAGDPGLAQGEARITGPWARADLTRGGALATVRAALEDAQ